MSKQLYYEMLRIRIVEETIADLYTEWEMRCPTHLSIGQEGAAVGVAAALRRDDYALGGHRSHGHYLAKGGDLDAFVAELYGKATGCCGGRGGSMHLVDLEVGFLGCVPIVGSTIPIATGVALGVVQRGEDRVVAAFFGDAATEEGAFYESMNFAALDRLPVLFVCENNEYSVYTHVRDRQPPGRDLGTLSRGFGVAYAQADGNDPEAVRRVAEQAAARARGGGGPSLLELSCYRWREHCGPNFDDELGYRPEGELARHQALCPVRRLESRLLAEGLLDADAIEEMRARIRDEMARAVRFAKASPFPSPEGLHDHVFATAGGPR